MSNERQATRLKLALIKALLAGYNPAMYDALHSGILGPQGPVAAAERN